MALQALARFWPLFGVGEAFRGRPKGCGTEGVCVCSEHSSGEVNGKGSLGAVASQRGPRLPPGAVPVCSPASGGLHPGSTPGLEKPCCCRMGCILLIPMWKG